MTEGQKKLAIVAVIVVAIILLFWPKRAGAVATDQNGNPINVEIPSLSLPPRTGMVINIPGLPSFSPYAFSPISPCMCNGAEQLTPQVGTGLQITNITNLGAQGPNIYNYQAQRQQDNIGFTAVAYSG